MFVLGISSRFKMKPKDIISKEIGGVLNLYMEIKMLSSPILIYTSYSTQITITIFNPINKLISYHNQLTYDTSITTHLMQRISIQYITRIWFPSSLFPIICNFHFIIVNCHHCKYIIFNFIKRKIVGQEI